MLLLIEPLTGGGGGGGMMYTHNGFVVSQGNEWVLMGRPLTQLVSLDYNELLGMGGGVVFKISGEFSLPTSFIFKETVSRDC